MNIKQAEQQSGVPRTNIRFYEKEGLLCPARNKDNDYREYTEGDIRTLKLIRTLRSLDMPLDEVARVLNGSLPLPKAAAAQRRRLERQARTLGAAIRFCGELQADSQSADTLDVDACLARMQAPEPGAEGLAGWFTGWLDDYRAVAAAAHADSFTFTPDTMVENRRAFTDALLAYGRENDLDLVVTRESMYPGFTIDGVEYTADRAVRAVGGGGFTAPLAVIRCYRVHPVSPALRGPAWRRRLFRLLHAGWPALLLAVMLGVQYIPVFFHPPMDAWEIWSGIVVLGGLAVWLGAQAYINWHFHGNFRDP